MTRLTVLAKYQVTWYKTKVAVTLLGSFSTLGLVRFL